MMPNPLIIRSGECKKFAPNIFNKTKCTNCFRQKEEHSAEALESNRATRKVAKCGYLFVAPGWDFTNPINRTKRWQRRWFVLYDDGELSYSVDEHPETVPQACIDMNKVRDVSDAEELTGNPYSLAITTHDGVHFVKATCREEAKWWMDVLSVFPRSKSRHKRNSAFSKTPVNSPVTPNGASAGSGIHQTPVVTVSRQGLTASAVKEICSRYIWTGDESLPSCSPSESDTPESHKTYIDVKAPRICSDAKTPRICSDIKTPRICSDIKTPRICSDLKTPRVCSEVQSPRICSEICLDSKNRTRRIQISQEKRALGKHSHNYSEDIPSLPNWREKKSDISRTLIIEDFDAECKLKDVTDSITRPPHSHHSSSSFSSSNQESLRDSDLTSHKQVRGDPDGCGLDLSTLRYSPSSELRIDSVSEDLLNIKKGWLMKQGAPQEQEWNKHWFVLRGAALLYYRDPTAEDQGILDGVIDLSVMNCVNEVQVARNYGFQITSWDEKRYTLSAVTAGIRTNWIAAIKRAAGIHDDVSKTDTDKEVPTTPRSSLLSSDEEYRTASENGRRGSSSDWGETLPPSPPLNRTPISRVKERARGVTRARIYNTRNSKSSPPSSKHSTFDSIVRRQDILPSCSEVNVQEKNERSPLLKKLEKQAIEYEEVKRQLTAALRQLSSAEEELLRLRQRQQDVVSLEHQMDDMKHSLHRAEKELAEYESLKTRYAEEKSTWHDEIRAVECELRETDDRYAEVFCELTSTRQHVEQLRIELADVSERLARGIEENESLYRRLRELEGRSNQFNSIRESKGRSLDSLSDLTNIDFDLDFNHLDKERIVEEYEDVRIRFEKAVQEIRAMKRELRESHTQTDCLELNLINARQDLKCKQEIYQSQASMMGARIQDLTTKLLSAEKQVRVLKQKLSKTENREKRRSLSLKGRESYAMCKELEEKLSILEHKISVLNGQYDEAISTHVETSDEVDVVDKPEQSKDVTSRVRRKSLDSVTNVEPMKILIRMNSLETKVADFANKIVIKPASPSEETISIFNCDLVSKPNGGSENLAIRNEVKNIENLLKKKLVELYTKQKSLQNAGMLNNEAKLNIMAEKLAYESVLICRLHEIVSGNYDMDIADAERLMNELDGKLNGDQFVTNTSLEYFANSLSQYLMQIGANTDKYMIKKSLKRKVSPEIKMLRKKSVALSEKVDEYLTERIEELSTNLVCDSNNFINDNSYIKNIIELADQTVNEKLIQVEISQIMSHCTNIYAAVCKNEKEVAFKNLMVNRADLEQWTDNVMTILHDEINTAVQKLRERFQEKLILSKVQNIKFSINPHQDENIKTSLQQFVDVIAHKCLLDAKLLIVNQQEMNSGVDEDSSNEISTLDEATMISEVQFLYAKLQRDLQLSGDEKRVFDSLESVEMEVSALYNSVEDLVRNRSFSECIWDNSERIKFDSSSNESSWLDGVCRRCSEIKEQIINLQTCLSQNQDCQKCLYLQEQLQRRETEFEEERRHLEDRHHQALATLQLNFENERKSLISKHEQDESILRERARKLERRLDALDSEYTQQIDNLRDTYHANLSSSSTESDFHHDEDSIKQRYQSEIEQLQGLCEKGLSAMDNSHRRMIAELEEKHRQEIESLKLEKEQALAEETRATLSALDAMRKAHEAEVQKEIAKFKTEYLKKMESTVHDSSFYREHEAEMDEIKREILSLSEKYSIKCVESASLEEELRVANSQLAQAQQHIMQLDSRNKQLRAHLMSETNDRVVDIAMSKRLDEKTKEILDLQNQLTMHDDTLKALCMHLSNGQLDKATLNSLLEKLRLIILTNHRISGGSKPKNDNPEQMNICHVKSLVNSFCTNSDLKKCANTAQLRSKMVMTRRSPSPCAPCGMVAERKKLFETIN